MHTWMNSEAYHALLTNLWGYSCAFMQILMPYWNFEVHKGSNPTLVKVGGGIDPATKLTLGLN